jgi:NAD(P)-dependent dehydrogenase (short-subunit alcohol dehydrogenase family)
MGLLDGHRALVTGGGSGIGRATCRRMAAEGARIAVVDIDGDRATAVAEELDGVAYAADVTDYEALAAAVDDAAARLGGLSILFNNAGTSSMHKIHEWPLEEWNRFVDINLHGVFQGMRAAIPHLLADGDGRVVSTASISGTRPAAGEAPYSAAKAAVIALTANAALEYGPTIRVNAISPGMIRTSLTEPLFGFFPELEERFVRDTPVARVGDPEDIADVVLFLCSDLARFVTGQNMVIDGGLTLHGSGVDGVMAKVEALMSGSDASPGSPSADRVAGEGPGGRGR